MIDFISITTEKIIQLCGQPNLTEKKIAYAVSFGATEIKDQQIREEMAENIINEEYNPDLITLQDDDGKEYSFEVLDAIETDMGRYLALLPTFDDPSKLLEDSGELVIVKVGEEDGEEYFYEIEDDDEYETVADAFVDRLQDLFEIDEK